MAERITQDICIELQEGCCNEEDSIFIYWLNTLGGLSMYRANCVHRSVLEIDQKGEFERYFPDIANQNERGLVLKKEAVEIYTVAIEPIKRHLVSPVAELFSSPLTMIWRDPNYIKIKIDAKTQEYTDTDKQTLSLRFSFLMPKLYTVGW